MEEFNGIWLRDPFSKASKVTERIGLCFTQAYTFEYRKGQIVNIYAPEDVSVMCVNIIRGILNLLQLTIEESQNVYELQEVWDFFPPIQILKCKPYRSRFLRNTILTGSVGFSMNQ